MIFCRSVCLFAGSSSSMDVPVSSICVVASGVLRLPGVPCVFLLLLGAGCLGSCSCWLCVVFPEYLFDNFRIVVWLVFFRHLCFGRHFTQGRVVLSGVSSVGSIVLPAAFAAAPSAPLAAYSLSRCVHCHVSVAAL